MLNPAMAEPPVRLSRRTSHQLGAITPADIANQTPSTMAKARTERRMNGRLPKRSTLLPTHWRISIGPRKVKAERP